MPDLLARWIPRRSGERRNSNDNDGLPFPATQKPKRKPRELGLTATISRATPRPLYADYDVSDDDEQLEYPHAQHGSSRSGPSNVAWLESGTAETDSVDGRSSSSLSVGPWPVPPAVVRVCSRPDMPMHPIVRSFSSPPASYDSSSASSSSPEIPPSRLENLGPLRNPTFSRSTQSLRLDSHPHITVSTDVYGSAYNYPLAKQLSPIQEQDYVSPASLRRSINLPTSSGRTVSSPSIASYASNAGSQRSEATRPSPSYSAASHPFITRQLNRTISQTSSRTHISSASSSVLPPTIPPLNLAPPFPGPHPNLGNGNGPPLRPRRSTMVAMPTIASSSESVPHMPDDDDSDDDEDDELAAYGNDDLESLHAESFVTASEAVLDRDVDTETEISIHRPDAMLPATPSQVSVNLRSQELPLISHAPSVGSSRAGSRLPSTSESFIGRRWDRDAALGSGVVTFRVRRQWIWITCTPAFWAFWLGFICPFLWLVGGWHFTWFGEQPPKLTCWEFYFWTGRWKDSLRRVGLCCSGKRRKRKDRKSPDVDTATENHQQARLPRWVAEKQSSDDGRLRLNDPKRSLRGISFGYPFIPRPVERSSGVSDVWCANVMKRVLGVSAKPNRFLDHLYGVKLREVRGRPESGRRMFDPWIQRCRYAFCYAVLLLCLALCTISVYLIIYNTRQL